VKDVVGRRSESVVRFFNIIKMIKGKAISKAYLRRVIESAGLGMTGTPRKQNKKQPEYSD
jgi:hypothetical protein